MTRTALLATYSAVVTTLMGIVFVSSAVGRPDRVAFDEIDVKRINIREDDGTLRMTLSNTSRFPGIIFRGEEHPHPDRSTAGMLFFNDEGTENGGLIFGGRRAGDGTIEGYGHLSFDQFEQDQVVELNQSEDADGRLAGLTISDRPDASVMDVAAQLDGLEGDARTAVINRLRADGQLGYGRAFLGKDADRASKLDLRDALGRTRLRLHVAPDGAATIQFLEADGQVQRTVTPEG